MWLKYSRKKGKTPAETITWTNIKQSGTGRQGRHNIISGKPGPTSYSKGASNEIESWNLFFSEDMLTDILDKTNERIEMFREIVNPDTLENNKITYIHNTTLAELYAFFGLVYARGLQGQNTMSVEQLFSESYGHPIFSATISNFCTRKFVLMTKEHEKLVGSKTNFS